MLIRWVGTTLGPLGTALVLALACTVAPAQTQQPGPTPPAATRTASPAATSPAPTNSPAPAPQAASLDPVYVQGYTAGYRAGQGDRTANAPANPHKFFAYQQHSAGAYRSGFTDGYQDGYAGHPASITAAQAGNAAGQASAGRGRGIGYREGYSAGEFDAGRNAPYGYATNADYQRAAAGYGNTGDFAQYQTSFRQGFREGYDDGYHHRLYNSAIGIRPDEQISGTVNAPLPPAGPLPRNPEVARALDSGNYSNGTLVAEGTILDVRLDTTLSTKTNRPGDPFQATTTVPVWVGSEDVIPAGSTITGTVESVKRGGHFHGNAQIQLSFDTLRLPGGVAIPLHAQVSGVGEGATHTNVNSNEGTVTRQGQNSGRRVATATGVGTILGAIFGGGRGALIGGVSGAAMGTAGVLVSRKRDLKLFTGEALAIRLERPLLLRKLPPAN